MSIRLKLFAAAVIVIAVILAITSVWNDSIIIDEDPHIGAGYSYLTAKDMRINPEHPPLAKDLAAVPLLFMDIDKTAFATKAWTKDLNGQWEFGRHVIFNSGADAQTVTRAAKMPMLLFFILSAALVCKWAFERYGKTGAILSLLLFAFSPTVMAHARFVTTDVAALFGVLFAIYFYVRFLKHPTKKTAGIAAVMFGIALLAKFSTFLLVPSLGLTAVLWGFFSATGFRARLTGAFKQGVLSVLIFAAGFIFVVWPVYYFHTVNYPPAQQYADTQQLLATFGKRYLVDPVIWASDKPVLRGAAHYGLGLSMVTQRAAGGNTMYFLGEVAKNGGKKYFPLVYLMKEPIAWWLLVLISLGCLILHAHRPPFKTTGINQWFKLHFEQIAMVIWLAIYWFMSIRSPLNIGVRHLLPTFPFMIILVSGQIARLADALAITDRKKMKQFLLVIAVLIGWFMFENLNVWPYYLTYFNQAFGGPSGGYKYVVDSNLDWGQDLKRLSDWVITNDIRRIELDYFGWADPDYYMPGRRLWLMSTKYRSAEDFLARNMSDGWIAISASFFQGTIGTKESPEPVNYLWLRNYKPVTVIGNSIFVWHITR